MYCYINDRSDFKVNNLFTNHVWHCLYTHFVDKHDFHKQTSMFIMYASSIQQIMNHNLSFHAKSDLFSHVTYSC